jgi:microcystin-dependent protein
MGLVNRKSVVILGVLAAATTVLADVTGPAGGGQKHTNYQPSLGLNYIIKVAGDSKSLGEVRSLAGNMSGILPNGWLRADGQLLSVQQNQALFQKLGVTYGGDATNTFALPDLRDRAVIGKGQGPALTSRVLGETVGSPQSALTLGQMPGHAHSVNGGNDVSVTGGGQAFSIIQPSIALTSYTYYTGNFPMHSGSATSAPFIGQVRQTAAINLPAGGVVPTNGNLLPVAQNTAMFAILGTTYGGNGQTTFAVPDLRGRAAVHEGAGVGLTQRDLGEVFGSESQPLNASQIPAHDHSLPGGGNTGLTGGNQPYNNDQPSLGLNYIISLQGDFPIGDPDSSPDVDQYLGEVSLFAGNFAPTGWALCHGPLMSIQQNTALFALLGTTYGGNGQTTFALPDLRGRTGVDDGLAISRGQMFGADDLTLTVDQLPVHDHTLVPEPSLDAIALTILGATVTRRRRIRNAR